MAVYKVKKGQNIFDVAVSLYGSVEGVFDLLISNETLGMNSELNEGDELNYHDYYKINPSVVKNLSSSNTVIANGERKCSYKNTNEPLCAVIKMNDGATCFLVVVAGHGTITFDWGDNGGFEEIELTNRETEIAHYFNDEQKSRRVRVYGNFELYFLDESKVDGTTFLVSPIVIEEYKSENNDNGIQSLSLFSTTYSVSIAGKTIDTLLPLGNLSLSDLDLRGCIMPTESFTEYVKYIVGNYGNRRPCLVYVDGVVEDEAKSYMDVILGEESWNVSGSWQFIINGEEYIPT